MSCIWLTSPMREWGSSTHCVCQCLCVSVAALVGATSPVTKSQGKVPTESTWCREHINMNLNQGSILTKYVCGSRWGMSCGMLLHTTRIYRPYVRHTVWHFQICLTQMCGRQHSLAMEMEVGDDGAAGPLWLGYYKHQTASPRLYSKHYTCHMHLTSTCIWRTCIVCTLAWGKHAHAYS